MATQPPRCFVLRSKTAGTVALRPSITASLPLSAGKTPNYHFLYKVYYIFVNFANLRKKFFKTYDSLFLSMWRNNGRIYSISRTPARRRFFSEWRRFSSRIFNFSLLALLRFWRLIFSIRFLSSDKTPRIELSIFLIKIWRAR